MSTPFTLATFMVAVSWELLLDPPAVDVDHFLLAQEVIGALR